MTIGRYQFYNCNNHIKLDGISVKIGMCPLRNHQRHNRTTEIMADLRLSDEGVHIDSVHIVTHRLRVEVFDAQSDQSCKINTHWG